MTTFEKACDEVDRELFTGETEQENVVEFIRNSKIATATFSQRSWVTKMQRLAEKFPDEVQIVAVNKDVDGNVNSVVAHFPVSFLHINHRVRTDMTDEQKMAIAERLKSARQKSNNDDADDDIDE